jgi:hypothetical protein
MSRLRQSTEHLLDLLGFDAGIFTFGASDTSPACRSPGEWDNGDQEGQ